LLKKLKTPIQVAGNGAEENRNNSYPARAAFAQPSGICFDRTSGTIFVADSESSSVRSVSLSDNGAVKGVCGASKNPMDLVILKIHTFGLVHHK
jgi:sugar lactone lactonase YvrE